MAEIVYRPWKEIILHEVKKVEIKELLEAVISHVEAQKATGTPFVTWADGVAWIHGEFPDTSETISDKLKGTLHWATVTFAETSYQEQKKVMFNGKEYSVRLLKADWNADLMNVAKFLSGFSAGGTTASVGVSDAK